MCKIVNKKKGDKNSPMHTNEGDEDGNESERKIIRPESVLNVLDRGWIKCLCDVENPFGSNGNTGQRLGRK